MATLPHAMTIEDNGGILPGFQRAKRFAGTSGRIATLPDLISAAVRKVPGTYGVWYTTSTSISCGLSPQGKPIFVVAHGVGPLMSEETRETAYGEHAIQRGHYRFGSVDREQFHQFAKGRYGDVTVIDASPYLRSNLLYLDDCLPRFMEFNIRSFEKDPLAKALLGPDGGQYLNILYTAAQEVSGPLADNTCLFSVDLFFSHSPHAYSTNFVMFEFEAVRATVVSALFRARFVAVRNQEPIRNIREGVDLPRLADKVRDLQKLLDKTRNEIEILVEMQNSGVL